MKIKEGFVKRQIGDRAVAVPVGKAAGDFHGMINLNETGDVLWDLLKEETDEETVIAAMLEIYDLEYDKAKKSLENYLNRLRDAGALEET